MLNIEYIVSDRSNEVIAQGAYFDLVTEVEIRADEPLLLDNLPKMQADGLAIVSYLGPEVASLPNGSW